MSQKQMTLFGLGTPRPLHDDLVVDCFAGGGGASLGISWALGRAVDIAINHEKEFLRSQAVYLTQALKKKRGEMSFHRLSAAEKVVRKEAMDKKVAEFLISEVLEMASATDDAKVDPSRILCMRWVLT